MIIVHLFLGQNGLNVENFTRKEINFTKFFLNISYKKKSKLYSSICIENIQNNKLFQFHEFFGLDFIFLNFRQITRFSEFQPTLLTATLTRMAWIISVFFVLALIPFSLARLCNARHSIKFNCSSFILILIEFQIKNFHYTQKFLKIFILFFSAARLSQGRGRLKLQLCYSVLSLAKEARPRLSYFHCFILDLSDCWS